ncbi:MAG TPA: hypothetical protein VMZ71_09570 [Gemmataceae bacterium]|nr:hypothetical protein [Gemmataceae bacterium]
MPIPVECPDCRVELNIPEKLAGKTVKCPHCAGPVRVPFDEPEEEERPRERRTRPAPRREAPKRRAKSKGNSGVLIGAAVGMVVIIVAAVGVTVLVRSGKKGVPTDTAQKTTDGKGGPAPVVQGDPGPASKLIVPVPIGPIRPPLPDGWIDFRHPQGEYSVYVPRKPRAMPRQRDTAPEFNESGYYTPPTTIERPELICTMAAVTYPPQVMEGYRTGNLDMSVINRMFPGMTATSNRITWQGRVALEMSLEADVSGMMAGLPGGGAFAQELRKGGKLPNGIPLKQVSFMRYVVVGDRLYTFVLQNLYAVPTEAERRAFFESVVFGR